MKTVGNRTKHFSWAWNAILVLGVVCLVFFIFRQSFSSLTHDPSVVFDNPPKSVAGPRKSWQEIAKPHLDKCHAQVTADPSKHFEPIIDLLNRARNRTSDFAPIALGFGSKWRLVADKIPFTKGGRNETYLREEFERRVLRSSDLEQSITQAIESFLQEMRSHEGEMLVALRADLDDFPSVDWATWRDEELLKARFQAAIESAVVSSGQDFQEAVGTQLVSLIAGEVLTHVAVRLGVSAGILGAGSATSWATFGIGVIAGVIIDQIVCNVWTWISDPERELVIQIQHQFDTLQRLICHGEDETIGLDQHFLRIASERDVLRRKAIEELMTHSTSHQ